MKDKRKALYVEDIYDENQVLRAEIARLREGDHLEYSLAVTNNELRDEIARLRALIESYRQILVAAGLAEPT
jgi:hypothetical protein